MFIAQLPRDLDLTMEENLNRIMSGFILKVGKIYFL